MDSDGNLGQRGRVLTVVVRAEQQVLATAEKDADVGPSLTAVAAACGVVMSAWISPLAVA